MLLALFIPIIVGGIKYSQYFFEKRQKSIESLSDPNDVTLYKECAREIALEIAKIWDPSKTLSEQKNKIYGVAKDIYNSHPCFQKGGIRSAIPGLIFTTSSGDKIELHPSKKQFSYPAATGKEYVKISIASDTANFGKIKVQTDDQVGYAVPTTCNANIILAVPTNSGISGSLSKIGAAFGKFSEKFYHTRGVYMGIVPYSGKLSIPSDRRGTWTTKFPTFVANDAQQLLIGACLYATKGLKNTRLTEQYSWDNGCPIMFRRGAVNTENNKYGGNPYYSGNLFSALDPNGTDQSLKYIQMDLRPCTLSNASLLSMQCSNDCMQFFANPHAMVEPTDDIPAFKTKCNSLTSFNHSGNDSSFIFAALEWSNNMLQSWCKDPQKAPNTNGDSGQLGSESKTTAGRKNYIVLLVNKPDYFKDGEMTYVGFSDDYKEKSMIEEDVINFNSSTTSSKGILVFSGSKSGNANCSLTFPRKHLVKIVAQPLSGSTDATITFTNTSNKTKRLSKNTAYKFKWERDFYIDPDQITSTTSDGKYQITFTINNATLISAKISNETFSVYNPTCSKSVSGNTATITTNCKRPIKLTVTPKISKAELGSDKRSGFLNDQTFTFTNQTENTKLACILENASFKSGNAKKIVPDTGTETIFKEESLGENETKIYDSLLHKGDCTLTISDITISYHCYKGETQTVGSGKFSYTVYPYYYNYTPDATFTCCGSAKTISKGSYDYFDIGGKIKSGILNDIFADLSETKTFTWTYNTQTPTLTIKTGKVTDKSGVGTGTVDYYVPSNLKIGKCTVTWNNTKTKEDSLLYENNGINVKCGGTITIVIQSTISPQISWTKANGTAGSLTSLTSAKTIIIDPKEYKYVEQPDGTYKINLTLTDIASVSDPVMDDQTALFKYGASPAVGSNSGNVALSAYSGSNNSEKMRDATKKAYKGLSKDTTLFLIQFSKQSTDDYSYIGVPAGNIYNVIESTLETVLGQIADKIKSLAGYSGAKNVP